MITTARTKIQTTTIVAITPAESPSSSPGSLGVGVTLGDIGGVVNTLGGIVISATKMITALLTSLAFTLTSIY